MTQAAANLSFPNITLTKWSTYGHLDGVGLESSRTRRTGQPGWLALVATDDGPDLSGMTARFVSRSALYALAVMGRSDALRLGSRDDRG
jgi:hypothetical protein